jgi:hypothetical protein
LFARPTGSAILIIRSETASVLFVVDAGFNRDGINKHPRDRRNAESPQLVDAVRIR